MVTSLSAQGTSGETRPYDDRLMRLCEVLGAVHYLRELCGANDGQLWRDRMRELMDAEGSSALRRARLTRSFNNGYRSYSRTYNSCTAVGADGHQPLPHRGCRDCRPAVGEIGRRSC